MLVLAGTPIGCAEDASPRLVRMLREADVIAAEDTRRLRRLASELNVDVTGKIVSYFEGNERQRTPELIELLTAGHIVVLVTDAGMPSVSDPGYRLVSAALEVGIDVTTAPGPSAVVAALAVSGLPVDRFSFEGFAPRKAGERSRVFASLADEPRTMVFFESPHRVVDTLTAMRDVFGSDRPAALCRELTKTYEEVVRGNLAFIADWAARQEHGVRGEITLVVAGAKTREFDDDTLRSLVADAEATGLTRKDAIAQVVQQTGQRRKRVYDAAHS